MPTLTETAPLLDAVLDGAPLERLLAPLRFPAPLPLDARSRARLGLPTTVERASLAVAGSRRVLLLELAADDVTPEGAADSARTLARRHPAWHWLVIARQRATGVLTVLVPSPGAGPIPLLRLTRGAVRPSDVETVAALCAADGADPLIHQRWRETLGRDALTQRFYRDLEALVTRLANGAIGRADAHDRRTIALLATSRLLFLAFLEAKGWLNRDTAFLRHQMERIGSELHRRLLHPLHFGTLNTPVAQRAPAARAFGRVPFLNGGLFTRSAVESRCSDLTLPDESLAAVIGDLLARYRLTAREQATALSNAAVDPEMLGRAFESLMGAETRRMRGAFYTPQALVARVTDQALDALSPPAPGGWPRVIDPACGSGAFLVYALETLAARRISAGDPRPVAQVRRDVLVRGIFGVDVDPIAVWLCQLRLWLSVVVEDERPDPMTLPPLPNLDRNIRLGDALAGDVDTPGAPLTPRESTTLAHLRLRYARTTGTRKRTAARALDRAERERALAVVTARLTALTHDRRERLIAARTPDLFRTRHGVSAAERRSLDTLRVAIRAARAERRRLLDGAALPFRFASHFPEVAAAGGFDVVIGNPPWVRPHAMEPTERDALRERFTSMRQAAWLPGAEAAGAGRGFASQADLSALFIERGVQLLRPDGVLAYLVPAKLWRALAGGGIRRLLAERAPVLALEEWASGSAGFDAAVYPALLLARRADRAAPTVQLTMHRGEARTSWALPRRALALDTTDGAPWLIIPPAVRASFDRLAAAGVPLAAAGLGRPMLGVKSGCNEAFLVTRGGRAAAGLTAVHSGEAHGAVETAWLRPVLRGEQCRAWSAAPDEGEAIVWTHGPSGAPVATLPLATARWLARWRRRLEQRSDARHGPWWALFRTEAAVGDGARVAWADIGKTPRALVLPAADPRVPLNTCYVLRAPSEADAHALAALLNAPVVAAWLRVLAEPARGGYRRFLGWTCARLPIPRDWVRARTLLAPIGRAGAAGHPVDDATLDALVADAFGVPMAELVPLRDWHTG
jgi:N-6 DNA Methylase